MMNFNDIKNYEFKPSGRNAYRADEVDTFLAEVVIFCEKLYRENNELSKRVGLLADRLEEYKNDEGDIKQAVLSAQRAADIIIRDAKESVEDCKAEAESILAAAKGEAKIIREDAEKQAIADSDLILSKTKDKAEDIINKAKEKAHGILIAANNSASDKMGAANRTITSETLHYDMLKKEVSEFRSSILAQYKTHIELISKLPELAIEEAEKLEPQVVEEQELDITEEEIENPVFIEEDNEDTVLEYVQGERIDGPISADAFEVEEEGVVKTTLPYEFFSDEDPQIEYVTEEENAFEEESNDIDDGSIGFSRRNPLAVEDQPTVEVNDVPSYEEPIQANTGFTVKVDDIGFSFDGDDHFEDISSSSEPDMNSYEPEISDENHSETEPEQDIKSEYGSYSSFFDSIEFLDVEKAEATFDEQNKHKGFFNRNK